MSRLARSPAMHNALRDMGYDKSLERVADAIPDAATA
jgi:chemotaxis regulatin CheY-phosphate phosphatase CheZ